MNFIYPQNNERPHDSGVVLTFIVVIALVVLAVLVPKEWSFSGAQDTLDNNGSMVTILLDDNTFVTYYYDNDSICSSREARAIRKFNTIKTVKYYPYSVHKLNKTSD